MGTYKIELDTLSKARKFQRIAESRDYPVKITSSEGYIGNAKSLLNVMASLEWNDLYVTADNNSCYRDFNEFIIEQ